MIIVYGGCQADQPVRDGQRVPWGAAAGDLSGRLRGLLHSLEPNCLVGALASGADILFAKAALAAGIELEVLLPFDVATFRKTSVEPAASLGSATMTESPPPWMSRSLIWVLIHPMPSLTESTILLCSIGLRPWRARARRRSGSWRCGRSRTRCPPT